MVGLPKEIAESERYQNLPTIESRLKPGMEKYREELEACGIDFDELRSTRMVFLQSYLSQRSAFEGINLQMVVGSLNELLERYNSCFDMGFCDISMNMRIAIKEVLGE
jgi:hypothetical protein